MDSAEREKDETSVALIQTPVVSVETKQKNDDSLDVANDVSDKQEQLQLQQQTNNDERSEETKEQKVLELKLLQRETLKLRRTLSIFARRKVLPSYAAKQTTQTAERRKVRNSTRYRHAMFGRRNRKRRKTLWCETSVW
jgi:hypothetical protein